MLLHRSQRFVCYYYYCLSLTGHLRQNQSTVKATVPEALFTKRTEEPIRNVCLTRLLMILRLSYPNWHVTHRSGENLTFWSWFAMVISLGEGRFFKWFTFLMERNKNCIIKLIKFPPWLYGYCLYDEKHYLINQSISSSANTFEFSSLNKKI